ncbi:SMI1/KNR4 family protein [Amphibacillus cookii]|uniref:SMI1/KNR4 family protein n=1 Tax=Amphibacillus cookii TaxID=767787 RepID=UPI00195C9995|nr:SMI1/KNR4 family protein [Amphibacillus cookii]MBM7542021.1 hypothetical protein [Amphibacillus cookii]
MINIVSNKGFNENELIAFSEKIGYELPNDYIEFLRHHNGGYVKNSISTYYKNGEQKFILTSMFGLGSDDDLINQFETYKNRIPNTCIPIGRDAGGNLVCLNLSEVKYGYVYFWDHEEEFKYEEGKIAINDLYFIADSFKEFLNSIERDSIKESEVEGYEVKKVWVDPDFLKELENNSDK